MGPGCLGGGVLGGGRVCRTEQRRWLWDPRGKEGPGDSDAEVTSPPAALCRVLDWWSRGQAMGLSLWDTKCDIITHVMSQAEQARCEWAVLPGAGQGAR